MNKLLCHLRYFFFNRLLELLLLIVSLTRVFSMRTSLIDLSELIDSVGIFILIDLIDINLLILFITHKRCASTFVIAAVKVFWTLISTFPLNYLYIFFILIKLILILIIYRDCVWTLTGLIIFTLRRRTTTTPIVICWRTLTSFLSRLIGWVLLWRIYSSI